MKKKLTDNLGLKILAIIVSFVLWLIVINIEDPSTPKVFYDIPVQVINADTITSEGKVYEVLEGTNFINVTVTASRSVIDDLEDANIVAVADMSEISFNNVPITITSNKYSTQIESIVSPTTNLKINIENLKKVQLVISAITSGEPAEGYILGDVTTDQNLVRLSGPESIISQIAKAVATIDIASMTSDISTKVDLKLYDANDQLVDTTSVTKNIDSVNVTVNILGTKAVPLAYTAMGVPAEGFAMTGEITSTPELITIAGKPDVLAAITQIDIPQEALNVTGHNVDMTTLVNVFDYLPTGIVSGNSSFNGKANVVVHIEKETEKIVELTEQKIDIVNMPDGFEGTFTLEDPLEVNLTGLESVMNSINVNTLSGTIDITELMTELGIEELTQGAYDGKLNIALPENSRIAQEVRIRIEISKIEE